VPSPFLYEIGFGGETSQFAEDVPQPTENYFDEDQSQSDGFQINELVTHAKFGTGRVVEFSNLGPDSKVVIQFRSGNRKTLMVRYANLTRVGQ
jgi:DNA helicase-2/ATP-dependent DNA helicase PcrA